MIRRSTRSKCRSSTRSQRRRLRRRPTVHEGILPIDDCAESAEPAYDHARQQRRGRFEPHGGAHRLASTRHGHRDTADGRDDVRWRRVIGGAKRHARRGEFDDPCRRDVYGRGECHGRWRRHVRQRDPGVSVADEHGLERERSHATLSAAIPPMVFKVFTPQTVSVGTSSTLHIDVRKRQPRRRDADVGSGGSISAGLVVAASPNATTTCAGSLTAVQARIR